MGLAPFTTTATISGANSICTPITSSVYTIANVGTGNTVAWSSSNTAVATISNATSTQVTVNKVGLGNFNLIATITNSCGQTGTIVKNVRIGGAPINITVLKTTNSSDYDLSLTWPSNIANGLTSVTWTKFSGNGICGGNGLTGFADGSPTIAWTVTVKITATNDCGSIIIYKTYSNPNREQNPHPRRPSNKIKFYNVFPNPAKDIINISTLNSESFSKKFDLKTSRLYDKMGQLIQNIEIIDDKATFSVRDLPKGIYFLKIENNGEIETHQVSVE